MGMLLLIYTLHAMLIADFLPLIKETPDNDILFEVKTFIWESADALTVNTLNL